MKHCIASQLINDHPLIATRKQHMQRSFNGNKKICFHDHFNALNPQHQFKDVRRFQQTPATPMPWSSRLMIGSSLSRPEALDFAEAMKEVKVRRYQHFSLKMKRWIDVRYSWKLRTSRVVKVLLATCLYFLGILVFNLFVGGYMLAYHSHGLNTHTYYLYTIISDHSFIELIGPNCLET